MLYKRTSTSWLPNFLKFGSWLSLHARLGLTSSHRVAVDSAKRSIVLFVRDEPKDTLSELGKAWRTTSALSPDQRPTEKPIPWRQQVASWLVQYIAAGMSGSMDEQVQAVLNELQMLTASLEHTQKF